MKNKKPYRAAFRNILGHDLRYAFFTSWGKCVAMFLLALLIYAEHFRGIEVNAAARGLAFSGTVGDVITYLFRGMEVYVPRQNNPFAIPYIWAFINLMLAYITGGVNANLLNSRYMEFIQAQSKFKWWSSKCLASAQSVLMGYLAIYLSVFASVPFGIQPTFAITQEISGGDCGNVSVSHWVCIFILLPVLTSLCISVLQTLLSLYVKPVISYIAVLVILISSLFYCNPLFIGNGLLPLRSAYLKLGGNIAAWQVCLADGVILAVCYGMGIIKIRKTDLLSET